MSDDKKTFIDIHTCGKNGYKPNCHIDNDAYYIDYWSKLNKEEQAWMKKYGYATKYKRQRQVDIFTEHPEYIRLKQEIDAEINYKQRNRLEEKMDRVRPQDGDDMSQYFLDRIVADRWEDEDDE